MVAKGIPAIVFRPADDAGTQRVEINIGHTVYEGFSFINDDTFEAVAPKIATPVMSFVVKSGKADIAFYYALIWKFVSGKRFYENKDKELLNTGSKFPFIWKWILA